MRHKHLLKVVGLVALVSTPAFAASPVGNWRVQDGSGTVRIASCGRSLCGYTSEGKVILSRMGNRGQNTWSGTIIDVRWANSRYDGTISLSDRDTLRVKGCLQGSQLCGEQRWTRAN